MMRPTPTLDQAYSMLIQEDIQRNNNGTTIQTGILGVVPIEGEQGGIIIVNSVNAKSRMNTNGEWRCDYYKRKGHTKDKCYKLNGYLLGFKFNNNRRKGFNDQPSAHNTIDTEEFIKRAGGIVSVIQGLSNAQYLELMQMIDKAKMNDKAKHQYQPQVEAANMAGPLQWKSEGDW